MRFTAGGNSNIVGERLGHFSLSITLDIYSHVMPGMQAEAELVVENLSGRPD